MRPAKVVVVGAGFAGIGCARELAKHDETEQIRTSLALAVCGTAMATDRIDDAIARLSDPSSWMGVVA